MLIPNSENAIVDIRKLRDYCLNLEHNDGKHKARLFASMLRMTADNAEELRQILLEVVKVQEAQWEDEMSLGSATRSTSQSNGKIEVQPFAVAGSLSTAQGLPS